MDFGGRKELFRALTGSYNYNMNTPESDKDYKVFVLPTFDDLYNKVEFAKSYIGETEDYGVHDVRKLNSLWWKSNINFLEVLFSESVVLNTKLNYDTKIKLNVIFEHRDEIAKMNLPYLYDACIGMYYNKKNFIDKGTEGTQYLVDKFGYDTKHAMHSLRVLDFLERFAGNYFTDFKQAIWYENDEEYRNFLLNLKHGNFLKEEFMEIAEDKLKLTERLKDVYKSKQPNAETDDHLLRLIKGMVRIELI
jgi:hypothetical protein